MSEQRFACTACGLCCFGLVPLTVNEALANSGRFPLAMTITPVKTGTRGYSSVEQIGTSVVLSPKKKLSLLVMPVSFVPPSLPCPELAADNLCSIHAEKPIRCRSMPFYAYKDEDHQQDTLIPRKGWLCETGAEAPVVYRDRKIVDRTDFDAERNALIEQTPALRRFVALLLQHNPVMQARVLKASQTPLTGRVVVGFVSFLRYDKKLDLLEFARRQYPVLETWAQKTAGDTRFAEYHNYYREGLSDLQRYMQ